ncbi:NIF-domain-containing protein [Zopfia rhizophila CBS 207.26]|uniref:Mitochondrial import inner membrane translocase subunit TIM50 n=1 Tax=Zopfia rhizophila CBS 207.26 TaxID=1314779 RepID=A0A6A6E482_9PEZI|nr:NIF-domain-containing protein [Zopfia rhizophila CBS 207.26]
MLPRAASRALRIRPAPLPFPRPALLARPTPIASTSQWIRSFADNSRPPKKPGQDHAWEPSDTIKFGAPKNANSTSNPVHPNEQPEFDTVRSDQNTAQHSEGAGPGISEAADLGRGSQQEFSKEQTEFSEPQPSKVNTEAATETAEQSQKPLPDLRKGIPSTFGAEFGKEGAKERSNEDPFNITEDPEKEPAPGTGGTGGREGGELPKSAYETSTDRRRNRVANWGYLSTALLGTLGAIYLGRNWETEEEEKTHANAPSGWGLGLMYNRAKARLNSQMGYYTEPAFPKLLPEMPPGQVPPYTLVISMEDMLVHSEWTREHGWRTAKRPGMDYFLRYLSQYYELVIFTTLPFQTGELVYRKLDPFRIVMWPLFREACRYEKGEYVKDLSYLNRDLSKTIILDTNPAHTKLQPENAIILPKWTGQPQDKGLVALIPFLEYIGTMGVNDVRTALASFEDKDIPAEFARREARAREAFNKQLAEEKAKKPKHSAVGWVTKSLGLKQQPQGLLVGEQTASEGFEQGKMLSDQIRERGMKNYEALEKEIRENGEKWLKEMEAEEKRAQEEAMKGMKSGVFGWLGGDGGPSEKK